MSRLYIALFFSILFYSCGDFDKNSNSVFIGGHIVNPHSELLIVFKGDKPLDTIELDQNNRFTYYIEDIEAGDYKINHHNENQTLYLHPGDSIQMYANTMEFDESLYFSGMGAQKNNLLIDLYLLNEQNSGILLSSRDISPQEFKSMADSIYQERVNLLEIEKVKHQFSEDFVRYAQGVIKYENFDLRERYLYLITRYYPQQVELLTDNFLAYREMADFNNQVLQTNPTYLRFIGNYLLNESLRLNPPAPGESHNIYSLQNIQQRIDLIDSLSHLDPIRDQMFSDLGTFGMVMGTSREDMVGILTQLIRKGYGREERNVLRQLGYIQLAFLPGVSIGIVPAIAPSGEKLGFDEVISKKTVLFLWSSYALEHSRKVHSLMDQYKQEFPELDFIGVNIDVGQTHRWRETLKEESFGPESEYQLGRVGEVEEIHLLRNYLTKSIFLDSDGIVVIGDADYNSQDFENRLEEFRDYPED